MMGKGGKAEGMMGKGGKGYGMMTTGKDSITDDVAPAEEGNVETGTEGGAPKRRVTHVIVRASITAGEGDDEY
jgi:hypothetical protein